MRREFPYTTKTREVLENPPPPPSRNLSDLTWIFPCLPHFGGARIHYCSLMFNTVSWCKPYAKGLELMNAHHSLVFSTRWTNQTQKNERVRVLGSIWLRRSHSHVRQAICGGDGGWQHMGANPVDLGDLGDLGDQTHPIILLPLRPPGGDRSGAPWKIDSISTLWSQFPNNGDPPAGFAASQDVHLFKGRGRGGGLSGANLTVFSKNLDTFRETFWPTPISNISINLTS